MSEQATSRIRVVEAATDELYNHVFEIRTTVFVDGESVDQDDEYDGFDHLATHYLAYYEDTPVGAARWRKVPLNNKTRLERFAVLEAYRGKGVGRALLERVMDDVPKDREIFVHAQLHNLGFYGKFGFESEGEDFEEAGIMHRKMVYQGSMGREQ
ncbi:MAG: GNAT family N-acetyltransferase [Bacteroidota bacterium]